MKIFNLVILVLFGVLFSCATKIQEDFSPAVSQTFSENWKFHAGEGTDSLWTDPNYIDSSWLEVSSKETLKNQNKTLDNGFGWYRKVVHFDDSLKIAIDPSGAFIIHLGKMAACDEVYFNGKLVGKTGEFPHNYMGYNDHERNYIVHTKDVDLKEENLIAIKFHDGGSDSGGFIGESNLSISSATTSDKVNLELAVHDTDYMFLGEQALQITVNLHNKNRWNVDGILYVSLATDDFKSIKNDSLAISIDGEGSYSENFELNNPAPGFYRYTIQFKRNHKLVCEKKFSVGYEPGKIVSPIDATSDFKEFWDNNRHELSQVSPNYKLSLVTEASKLDYDMYLVEMQSLGGEAIKGYYAKPKRAGKHPVIVEYMGYGSKPYFPNQTWDGFAYFVLSIRGQGLNEAANKFGTWITYGLENKENYYYRGAFSDVVRALDFVSSRAELDANRIAVRGGSQGGALAFVAAALDKRVKVLAPNIPFLSDYPDYFKIAHWPKSDFDAYFEAHPNAKWENIYTLLSYFDIKNLAQWIDCPMLMGIGMQDEVCPPHINFAAYNQVKSANKQWMAFPQYGHSVGNEFYEASMNLFRETLNVSKP